MRAFSRQNHRNPTNKRHQVNYLATKSFLTFLHFMSHILKCTVCTTKSIHYYGCRYISIDDNLITIFLFPKPISSNILPASSTSDLNTVLVALGAQLVAISTQGKYKKGRSIREGLLPGGEGGLLRVNFLPWFTHS